MSGIAGSSTTSTRAAPANGGTSSSTATPAAAPATAAAPAPAPAVAPAPAPPVAPAPPAPTPEPTIAAPVTRDATARPVKFDTDRLLQIQFFSIGTGFALEFAAFITQFSDTYNMEWSSDSVFGRMDPIATYKNTKRVINCAFTIPAASAEEAKINNQKFSKLLSLMYPNFNLQSSAPNTPPKTATVASTPLFKVKYANLIIDASAQNAPEQTVQDAGLLGYFTEFKYDPNQESNVFVSGSYVFPQSLNCAFSLNVLHTHRTGFGVDGLPFEEKFPHYIGDAATSILG
jgi:hypothetical protein